MIFLNLFWAFFKIGALGFGGGLAIVTMIYDSIQNFIDITEAQFAEIVAIAQVTPGPVAINTATYVGQVCAGPLGAAIATFGVAVPAFIIISIVARMVDKYRESSIITGALAGIKPATFGMIVMAGITLGRPTFFGDYVLGSASRLIGTLLPSGIDIASIVICILTIVLIKKCKIGSFKVLMMMAALGAILSI